MPSIDKEIKSKFTSAQQKAHLNIVFTHNWIANKASKVFKEHGITMQQYNVLRILNGSFPKSKTPTQVKEVMLDKNPDLTRLIDRLVKKEWVIRKDCDVNRRQVNLTISESGIKYLDKIAPEIASATNFIDALSDNEAETLSNLLDKVRN